MGEGRRGAESSHLEGRDRSGKEVSDSRGIASTVRCWNIESNFAFNGSPNFFSSDKHSLMRRLVVVVVVFLLLLQLARVYLCLKSDEISLPKSQDSTFVRKITCNT